ncbi:MAG: 2Fe-2S iron-sulfur cluster-binding protein, partial [Acidimicrobiales bacterium]|nr:2Fe-2S iron-sulfur cluster-binding protein [Acidimicrobiales bacterium]
MTNAKDGHLVVFTPSGHRGHVAEGTTVLDAARKLGVDLDSVCGGRGICGRCQVEPTFGEFAKHGITVASDNLSTAGAVEDGYTGRRLLTDQRRLGCAAKVLGDLVIDVPPDSQVHRQVVRKAVDLGEVQLDPVLVLRLVEVSDSSGDATSRVLAALADQ